MVHVSTMADDYYRFVERAHVLRGANTGKVYRLGDRVSVQVVKVDMERRQIDLGLVDILENVRAAAARGRGGPPRPRSTRESDAKRGARARRGGPAREKKRAPRSGKGERRRRKRP